MNIKKKSTRSLRNSELKKGAMTTLKQNTGDGFGYIH